MASVDPGMRPATPPDQNVGQPSKLDMAKAIARSPAAIGSAFKALAYQFIGVGAGIVSGEKGAHFKALSAHETNKLFGQYAKNYFGKELIGGARNIARKEVLSSRGDFEAGVRLAKKFESKDQKTLLVAASGKPPRSQVADGICAGIRLDIANRHLNEHEPILDIIASNELGASAEAAANQAIYESLDIKDGSLGLIFSRLFEKLNKIGESNIGNVGQNALKAGRGEARTNFTPVLRALVKYNAELGKDTHVANLLKGSAESDFERMIDDPKKYASPTEFKTAMEKKINEAFKAKAKDDPNGALQFRSDALKQLRWMVSFIEIENGLRNPAPPLQPESKGFMSDLWNLLKSILPSKETGSDLMDSVSDPQHKHVLKVLYENMKEDISYDAVADLRGLKLNGMDNVIGSSSLFASDVSFLKGLPNLWKAPQAGDGVYALDIHTGSDGGGHALTLVIEGQGGYILDPNGIQLKFESPEEAQGLLGKLLSFYEPPSELLPLDTEGVINHRITLRKFEKA